MLKAILLVGIGGAAGSALRYLTGIWAGRWLEGGLPLGTFTVNLVGCLLAGFLSGLLAGRGQRELHLLLITGFCGGYTTFSSFSLESFSLLQQGSLSGLVYMAASLLLGLAGVFLGLQLARSF